MRQGIFIAFFVFIRYNSWSRKHGGQAVSGLDSILAKCLFLCHRGNVTTILYSLFAKPIGIRGKVRSVFGRKKKKVKIFETKPKGRFISFLSQFVGALVALGAGGLFLIEFLSGYAYGIWDFEDMLPFFFLAGLGAALYLNGRKTKKLLSRFRFYKRFMMGRDSITLGELSDLTGRKVDFLRQDLHKMLERRFFLQGRFDEDEVRFFLTEEGYREYYEKDGAETLSKEENVWNGKKDSATKEGKRVKRIRNLWKEKVQEASADWKDKIQETSVDWKEKIQETGIDWKDKLQDAGEGLKSKWQEREDEKTASEVIKEGEEKNLWDSDLKTMATEYLVFYEKTQRRIQSKQVQRIVTDFGVYTVRILSYDIEEEARTRFFGYYLPLTKKLLRSYEEMEQSQMEEKASDLEDLLNTIRYSFELFAEKLAEGKGMDVETDILALNSMLNIE